MPADRLYVYRLRDAAGKVACHYSTAEEAHADTAGPRFRGGHTVRRVLAHEACSGRGCDGCAWTGAKRVRDA